MDWNLLVPHLAARGIELTPAAVATLRRLRELVLAENERTNLTRIVDEGEFVEKHALDSLLGLAALPAGPGRAVDVGSGGGFPGLPLAIARPLWTFVLVESLQKKASFLERAARDLGLANVTVLAERAEDAARRPGNRESFDAATVRAVSSVAVTLELVLPFLRTGGRALLYRGREEAEADEAAARAVAPLLGGGSSTVHAHALPSGAERRLIVVEKASPTPERFPRRAGMAEKRPLA